MIMINSLKMNFEKKSRFFRIEMPKGKKKQQITRNQHFAAAGAAFARERAVEEQQATQAHQEVEAAQAEQEVAGAQERAAIQARISALETTENTDSTELEVLRARLAKLAADARSARAVTHLAGFVSASTRTNTEQFARARGMTPATVRRAIEAPPTVCGTEDCKHIQRGPRDGCLDRGDGRWYCGECWRKWNAANGGIGAGGGDGKPPPPSGGKKKPGRSQRPQLPTCE